MINYSSTHSRWSLVSAAAVTVHPFPKYEISKMTKIISTHFSSDLDIDLKGPLSQKKCLPHLHHLFVKILFIIITIHRLLLRKATFTTNQKCLGHLQSLSTFNILSQVTMIVRITTGHQPMAKTLAISWRLFHHHLLRNQFRGQCQPNGRGNVNMSWHCHYTFKRKEGWQQMQEKGNGWIT